LSSRGTTPIVNTCYNATIPVFLTSLWRRACDHFLRLYCCAGTTHLFLLAIAGFLRSAAHEGVL